jgi:hypothetical protein
MPWEMLDVGMEKRKTNMSIERTNPATMKRLRPGFLKAGHMRKLVYRGAKRAFGTRQEKRHDEAQLAFDQNLRRHDEEDANTERGTSNGEVHGSSSSFLKR